MLKQKRSTKMKDNLYNAAEVVEVGKAEEVILGGKTDEPALDSSGEEPINRLFVEG
jgi:hypothetical protein